jgi:two-component system cell cycle response regulator
VTILVVSPKYTNEFADAYFWFRTGCDRLKTERLIRHHSRIVQTMTRKVLIVEDQPDSRRLLEDILNHFNTKQTVILSSRDGLEALGLIQKEKPDLILLDIMLPGMSGYDLCEKIKSNPDTAHAHIIVISARFHLEDRKEAIRRGADEYIVKPFDVQVLLEHVQKVLDISPTSTQSDNGEGHPPHLFT